jgi:hypothetical protein
MVLMSNLQLLTLCISHIRRRWRGPDIPSISTMFSGDQTNVSCWGKSGRHLLVLSVSQFDPKQTSPGPEMHPMLSSS